MTELRIVALTALGMSAIGLVVYFLQFHDPSDVTEMTDAERTERLRKIQECEETIAQWESGDRASVTQKFGDNAERNVEFCRAIIDLNQGLLDKAGD